MTSFDDQTAIYDGILPRDLEPDMEGRDVTALQSMLLALKYPQGKVDGYFGSQTQAAVMAFQKDHNIPTADGIVDRTTRQALKKAVSEIPDMNDYRINDRLLATGTSYTLSPSFLEGESQEATLYTDSPNVTIDGLTITGVASGGAEIHIECEKHKTSFFYSIRDDDEIAARIGETKNANNLGMGLNSRTKGLASYTGDLNNIVFLAGDCFLDERMFLRDFETRFAGKNIYSVALSGSTSEQWLSCIPRIRKFQPVSMVMTVGINDIRHKRTATFTAERLIELFGVIHENMPSTKIYWWNILPHRGTDEEYFKIQAVNEAIRQYAPQDSQLVVIDCYSEITDKNGVANDDLYQDEIHPNNTGYDRLFQKTFEAGLQIPEKP